MRLWQLAAGIAAAGYLDYITPELTPSLLYAILTLAAGYRVGRKGAVWAALACSLMHLLNTRGSTLQDASEGLLLLLVGWLGAAVQEQQERLRASHARVMQHLEAARRIQSGLLLSPPTSLHGLELAAGYRVAADLGGDFFFVHPTATGVVLCLGDVAGKGPPAALVAVAAQALLEDGVHRHLDPASLLGWLESRLEPMLPEGMFVTCFCACYDGGRLAYANAGHDPPLLLRAGDVHELALTGLPLGVQPQQLNVRLLTLERGDRLLLYTDGVPEPLRVWKQDTSQECVDAFLGQLPDSLQDDAMVLAVRRL